MTIPSEAADKLLAFAAERGVAPARLLAEAGVGQGEALSYPQLCALYEAAARLTGDAALGLHVGERTAPDDYGLIGYAAAHSATLGDALERLVELQAVWTEAVALELRREDGAAWLVYRAREAVPAAARRQECEQMMAALGAFVAAASGGTAGPTALSFEHPAPPDASEHRRVFGCPVGFGAALTAMVLPAEAFALPVAGADRRLGALIRAQAETALAQHRTREPLAEAVRRTVRSALDSRRAPSLAEGGVGRADAADPPAPAERARTELARAAR